MMLVTHAPRVPAKGNQDGIASQMASMDTARVKYLFGPDNMCEYVGYLGVLFIYRTHPREEEPRAWTLK